MISAFRTTALMTAGLFGGHTLLSPPLAAQTARSRAFEGSVSMRATLPSPNGAQTQVMEYLVREGKARVNVAGGAVSVLVLPAESRAYLLMTAQTSYREMPLPAAATSGATSGATPPGGSARGPVPVVTSVRLGRTETIAGLRCDAMRMVMRVAERADSLELCVTTELGEYVNPLTLMRGGADPVRDALPPGGFPLRVARSDGSVMLEVTKVERRRLDPALFSVPLDYTRVEAPRRR
jgi:hypothetical protein